MKKCSAFWHHVNLRNDDRIFPCCRFRTACQKFDGDLGSVLHSEQYSKLRSTDVASIPDCWKCMHEETMGKESLRQQYNKIYDTHNISLQYLELGLDNVCDLTCDGCWEEWSHSWAVKKGIPIRQAIKTTTEISLVPDSITKVVFLGGEPLMTNQHVKFLQKIKNLSQITVEYYTNGMHRITTDAHDLISRCKEHKITVSIDGYGELNERVRSGSCWTKVSNFALECAGKYHTAVHTTIHQNNWHGMQELRSWIEQNQLPWTTNVLTYPPHLDIKHMDSQQKAQCAKQLTGIPGSDFVMNHMYGSD